MSISLTRSNVFSAGVIVAILAVLLIPSMVDSSSVTNNTTNDTITSEVSATCTTSNQLANSENAAGAFGCAYPTVTTNAITQSCTSPSLIGNIQATTDSCVNYNFLTTQTAVTTNAVTTTCTTNQYVNVIGSTSDTCGPIAQDYSLGRVGYWPLDYNYTSTLFSCGALTTCTPDVSGYQNTGTVTGTHIVTGEFDNATGFNGPSDKIVLNPNTGMPSSAFTVSFWGRVQVHTGSDAFIQDAWQSVSGNWIIYGDASNWQYGIRSVSSYSVIAVTHGGSTTWHFFTMTYDGNTLQSAYLDGVFQSSATIVKTTLLFNSLQLGTSNSGSVLSMDDLRIYNYAFSAQQVANQYAWYENTLGGF